MDKQLKDMKKSLDLQEFFHEEYKKKTETQQQEIDRLKNALEKESLRTLQTVELPEVAADPADMEHKISALCAGDEEFEFRIRRAMKYAGEPEKEYTFIVLKHNDKTGKFDTHCESLKADLPLLPEIVERYGSGRYRLMVRYWDEHKKVKGNTIKGAFTLSYRDKTLQDTHDTRMTDKTLYERLYAEYDGILTHFQRISQHYTAIGEMLDTNIKLFKKLQEETTHEK
jgi:hypothetical protein